MAGFKLVAPFKLTGDQPDAVQKLVEGLNSGLQQQTLLGVTGSGKTFVMANVIAHYQKPTIVISHNKILAAQLAAEYRQFFPEDAVEYFVSYYDYYQPEAYVPTKDMYIEKETDINEEIEKLRNSTTRSLKTRNDVVVVASVSCIYNLGDPREYDELALTLEVGQEIERRTLLEKLISMQYERNDMELKAGIFRVRGDVIDIHPGYESETVRLQLDGDRIDRISIVDSLTSHRIFEERGIDIWPAKHHVARHEKTLAALDSIKAEMEQRVEWFKKQGKVVEADRLRRRTLYDIEMLRQTGSCEGVENYSRHIDARKQGEKPYCLLDYFPEDFLMIIDESHMTIPQLEGMYHGDISRKQSLVDYGFRLPSAFDNRPLKFDEFKGYMKHVICTSATPGPYERKSSNQIVELLLRPTGLIDPEITVKPVENQVDDLLAEIGKTTARHERVLVTTLTKKTAEMLSEYLVESGVKARYLHSDIKTVERIEIIRDLRLGRFDVLVGINLLREGLDLPEVSLVAILDADKEGFLRSEWALIQTMGRAARNVNGRVILYGDHISAAMQAAINETNRRREYQLRYNEQHGITPKTIVKSVYDIAERIPSKKKPEQAKIADFDFVDIESITELIVNLEEDMKEAARNLEFERAAELRDQIRELQSKIEGR
ncbi:MAG: excinuclease ABC subunit B [Candidatus Thorarchaeota archaeon]|nr:MAG: excinuclease ABC subunit B [Candidatus Thorarchaeota archaeon]